MKSVFKSAVTGAVPDPSAYPAGNPQDGNPGTGTVATKPGAGWFYMVTQELVAIVVAAGLTPAANIFTQVRDAILSLIGSPVRVISTQIITSSGTYTPNANTVYADVEVQAAGGGGGSSTGGGTGASAGGGAGGGGSATRRYTLAEIGANAACVVGAGGVGGSAGGSNGNDGGASSFTPAGAGPAISGNGGGRGLGQGNVTTNAQGGGGPGAGGSGSAPGGRVVAGQPGCYGNIFPAVPAAYSGNGGSARHGSGSVGTNNLAGITVATATYGYGGGASGGSSTTTGANGGTGAQGCIIITEYRKA